MDKKRILSRPPTIMKKEKEEFKVEDQYENRAIARRVKYKKNWHPVF